MTTVHLGHRRSLTTRYLAGDNLFSERPDGSSFLRDNVTSVTSSRWARLAGWKRSLIRLTTPPAIIAAGVSADAHPQLWAGLTIGTGTVLAGRWTRRTARRVRARRFRQMYVQPLARAVAPALRDHVHQADKWLHISPDLEGLAGRLAAEMSPAEIQLRTALGHVQPVLMYLPDRAMRVYWRVSGAVGITRARDWVRKPSNRAGARVEIHARAGFVTREQRELIRQAVMAKLALSDLIESWDQVGPVAVGTWTVRERPPAKVGLDEIRKHLTGLAEHEYIVGLTSGSRPVIVSLDDDAPHMAVSAGSGAGKSVLAKIVGSQVLAKGGQVVILDRKGSHRWARDLKGVTYCTQPGDMHRTLCELSAVANQRNDDAFEHEEGWDPGPRIFVIFEEMNATVAQLRAWWESNRQPGEDKVSPAIQAFRNIMFMGRSAKANLFGVAQMLTAQTTGGPEARENFGVRALARYTLNNWRMLAPEVAMPRKSKVRGRWQFVIAGEATEVQVAYLSDAEARELANVPMSPINLELAEQGKHAGTTDDGDTLVSLRDANTQFCPGISYEALKKRRDRARRTGGGPRPKAQRGRAELYDADELRAWLEAEELTRGSTSNV